ncbi:Uu.00g068360.m01.CDS01 [Anthostomella pinea]|uniref:Uu.00g068360.m01.CDS01 n=1 Tax=Anthostomella pinea TaxID=933095 RepID=A0AAI8YNK7_9PEZI|nr:Uu.00g068360.m01.CDS01 [Anthostomella pinea]
MSGDIDAPRSPYGEYEDLYLGGHQDSMYIDNPLGEPIHAASSEGYLSRQLSPAIFYHPSPGSLARVSSLGTDDGMSQSSYQDSQQQSEPSPPPGQSHPHDHVASASTTARSSPCEPGVTHSSKQLAKSDWDAAKPTIYALYVTQSLKLNEVRRRMDAQGFSASESMYKKHLIAWAKEDPTWRKQKYTKSGDKKRVRRARPQPLLPNPTSAATIPSPAPSPFASLPDQLQQALLLNTSALYRRGMMMGQWRIQDALLIQEDEYYDLFVAAFDTLYDIDPSDAPGREAGISKTFSYLRRSIQECGFYTVPTMFSTLLMIFRKGDMQFASAYAAEAFRLAEALHPNTYLHYLLRDLFNLVRADDSRVEKALLSAWKQCIDDATAGLAGLPFCHLSVLMLRIYYINQTAGSKYEDDLANEAQRIVAALEDLTELAEQIYERDDEVVLEILGQKALARGLGSQPTNDLEDLQERIASRQEKNGGQLQAGLVQKWQNHRHVLKLYAVSEDDDEVAWIMKAVSCLGAGSSPEGSADGPCVAYSRENVLYKAM